MKLVQFPLRSFNGDLRCQWRYLSSIRRLSTAPTLGNGSENRNNNSIESFDDFEQRIFGGYSGKNQENDSLFQELDKLEKARDRSGIGFRSTGMNGNNSGEGGGFLNDLDESFSTLSDGMDGKLKKAATDFEVNQEEIEKGDYVFRPDMDFVPGTIYDTKDLDLREPGATKSPNNFDFVTTTEEVLRKADFRNVKFLSNFLTDAGIIIKRSSTKISAKAQRKVAREIKTARAFGLMPRTIMGQERFVYGKSREMDNSEYEGDDHDMYEDDDDEDNCYLPEDGFVDEDSNVQEPF